MKLIKKIGSTQPKAYFWKTLVSKYRLISIIKNPVSQQANMDWFGKANLQPKTKFPDRTGWPEEDAKRFEDVGPSSFWKKTMNQLEERN